MSHSILVEGPYQDSPTKDPGNFPAPVRGSLLDDLRIQLSRPPGSIWPLPKNDPENSPQESSRFTPGLNKEEQATRCAVRARIACTTVQWRIADPPILSSTLGTPSGNCTVLRTGLPLVQKCSKAHF